MATGNKWEYQRHVNIAPELLERLGREGWELVGVIEGYVYLKRPYQEPPPIETKAKETKETKEAPHGGHK